MAAVKMAVRKNILLAIPRGPSDPKINLARNFQPRSNFLNPGRNFESRRLDFPHKNRVAVGGSLKNCILARNFQSRSKSRIFWSLGPLGTWWLNCQDKFCPKINIWLSNSWLALLSCKCHTHFRQDRNSFGINNCIDSQNQIREELILTI